MGPAIPNRVGTSVDHHPLHGPDWDHAQDPRGGPFAYQWPPWEPPRILAMASQVGRGASGQGRAAGVGTGWDDVLCNSACRDDRGFETFVLGQVWGSERAGPDGARDGSPRRSRDRVGSGL